MRLQVLEAAHSIKGIRRVSVQAESAARDLCRRPQRHQRPQPLDSSGRSMSREKISV